ncbi:hypothetical protein D3C80_1423330 [compost metagenome]
MGIDALDLDPRRTALGITELLRRGEGQIDDPVRIERPAVVDPQNRALAVFQVGHPHVTGQRQGLVRGGHAVQVVGFAVGGGLTVELGAVPGRRAYRLVAARVGNREVLLAEHHIGAGLDRAIVRHGYGIRDQRDVDIPPGCAVLVRATEVAGAGNARARLDRCHRLRCAGRRAARQQQRESRVGSKSERQSRHQLAPRAATSDSAS